MLDLATVVSMYRGRGEPVKAPAGEYFGCAHSFKLVREAKNLVWPCITPSWPGINS